MGAFEFAACLLIGDIDDDGDVDMLDIQQVATPWPGAATSPLLDLMVDGVIDIKDVIAVQSYCARTSRSAKCRPRGRPLRCMSRATRCTSYSTRYWATRQPPPAQASTL
jgi:hypothetical protein